MRPVWTETDAVPVQVTWVWTWTYGELDIKAKQWPAAFVFFFDIQLGENGGR